MAFEVDRTTTESGAYPLILLSYLIACPTYDDANEAALVKGFLVLHRVGGRPAGRRRTGRLRAARLRAGRGSRRDRRRDQVRHEEFQRIRDAASRPPAARRSTVSGLLRRTGPHPSRSSVTTTEAEPEASPPTQRGDRIFAGLPRPPGLTILAALAAVFIFLAVEGIPGINKPADNYAPLDSFCRTSAAALRHDLRRPDRAGHRGAVRAGDRAVHLALRAAGARRPGGLRRRPARRRTVGGLRPLGRRVLGPGPGAGPEVARGPPRLLPFFDGPARSPARPCSPPAWCWRS